MSVGSIFVSMDYDSVSERISKSIESGEEELEKLKKERETMEEELNVFDYFFVIMHRRLK